MDQMTQAAKSFSMNHKTMLAACLRFFAEGSYQHGIGKDFDIGLAQSTFSKCLSSVLHTLEQQLCPKWINMEMTNAEKRQAKLSFFEKTGFPGVVMCVDGTHVKILPPSKDKHLFYNRKGFYSINAMMVRIIFVTN